jgi:hypothetical protein
MDRPALYSTSLPLSEQIHQRHLSEELGVVFWETHRFVLGVPGSEPTKLTLHLYEDFETRTSKAFFTGSIH